MAGFGCHAKAFAWQSSFGEIFRSSEGGEAGLLGLIAPGANLC
jgi:hypothetical protein